MKELLIPLEDNTEATEKQWVHQLYYEDELYSVINTYEAFYNYSRFLDKEVKDVTSDNNKTYWNDFDNYISNQPSIGMHELLQVGNYIICCDFGHDQKHLTENSTKIVPSHWITEN